MNKKPIHVLLTFMLMLGLCPLLNAKEAPPKAVVKEINGDSFGISIESPLDKEQIYTIRPSITFKVTKAPSQENLWSVRLLLDGYKILELQYTRLVESGMKIDLPSYLSMGHNRAVEVQAVSENGEISSKHKINVRVSPMIIPFRDAEGESISLSPFPNSPMGIQALWAEEDKHFKITEVQGASQGNITLKGWGAFTFEVTERLKEASVENLSLVLQSSTGEKQVRSLKLNLDPKSRIIYLPTDRHKTLSGVPFPIKLMTFGKTQLEVLKVINPLNGSVVENGQHEFLYTSNSDFSGVDRFLYFMQDKTTKLITLGESIIEVVAVNNFVPPKLILNHVEDSAYINNPMLFIPIETLLPLDIESCKLYVDGELASDAKFTQKHMTWSGGPAMNNGKPKKFRVVLVVQDNSLIEATDGNVVEESFTLKIDTIPPKVEFEKKDEEQVYSDGIISIKASVSDEGSGIDYDSIQLFVDGEKTASGANALTWSGNQKEGLHVLTIVASDKAKNFGSSSHVVMVDKSGPEVLIERNGLTTTSSREPVFNIQARDNFSEVSYISIEVNGSEIEYGPPKEILNEDDSWQIPEGIVEAEGEYVLKVTAWDKSKFKSDKEFKITYVEPKPLITTKANKSSSKLKVQVNPRKGYSGAVVIDGESKPWTFTGKGGSLVKELAIPADSNGDTLPVKLMGSDIVFEDDKGKLSFTYKLIRENKGGISYRISGLPIHDTKGYREMKYFLEEKPKGWSINSETGELSSTKDAEDGMIRIWAADKQYTMIGRELNFYAKPYSCCACDPFISVGHVVGK